MNQELGLQASELRFGYHKGVEVVGGIGLEVRAHELVAIVGPNGSGKSTLLRLLGGLLSPRSGSVHWNGTNLTRIVAGSRAREIALLPQHVEPLYAMSARRIVELARFPHVSGLVGRLARGDHDAVEEALSACDASAFADRDFDTLSGGERQRVLLASAMAQGGALLLLDEPTTALDLTHQVSAMRRLRELADEGRAVVVVTHDLSLAAAFATRVVMLSQGRVAADGPVDEVIEAEQVRKVFGEGLWVGKHPAAQTPCVLPGPEAHS